jgi:hypothetical protein
MWIKFAEGMKKFHNVGLSRILGIGLGKWRGIGWGGLLL